MLLSMAVCNTINEDTFGRTVFERIVKIEDTDGAKCTIKNPSDMDVLRRDGTILLKIHAKSLHFHLYCPTEESLLSLWERYSSGELLRYYNKLLRIEELKQEYNLPNAYLSLHMSHSRMEACLKEIRSESLQNIQTMGTTGQTVQVMTK